MIHQVIAAPAGTQALVKSSNGTASVPVIAFAIAYNPVTETAEVHFIGIHGVLTGLTKVHVPDAR